METDPSSGINFSGLIGTMLHTLIEPCHTTVKPGGYPDNIFLNLSEEEREQNSCNICFLVVKDARECPNHHLFCAPCIFRWSMSDSATNSKCPVCRTEGRYRPQFDIEKQLNKKHVKCPVQDCTWAGKLQDFKWHSKRHGESDDETETTTLPSINQQTRDQTNSGEFPISNERSNQRLEQLMDAFQDRLQQRAEAIERYQEERERQRQESMQEVESLGRRLVDVSSNLMRLLGNMHDDSQRYQGYVQEAQNVLPSLANHHEQPLTSDDARVERILASPTPTVNPFVVPNEFRTLPRSMLNARPQLMHMPQQSSRSHRPLQSRNNQNIPGRTGRLSRSRIRPNTQRDRQYNGS